MQPNGQERVNFKLERALKCISIIRELESKPIYPSTQKRIDSNKRKLTNTKKQLVFLSTKARDKVTRFYASNALKEIAQKLRFLD
jgi:hypothetical protein